MVIQFDETKRSARLSDLYKKEEEDLARMLSVKYGVDYIDLTRLAIETDALRLLKEKVAKSAEVAAFKKIGKTLFVAMRAPVRDDSLQAIKILEKLGFKVRKFMTSTTSLDHAWGYYKDISKARASEAGILNISAEELQNMSAKLKTVEDVRQNVDEAIKSKQTRQVSRTLEVLLGGGLALNASDIHIEPTEEIVRIRYRLDGMLTDILDFDHATFKLIASRIKLLSGMKLNITNLAQDGRFSVRIGEGDVEIRSSLIPGNYGETIVMRLLNPARIGIPLKDLGIDDFLLDILLREIRKPNGLILNTGPTGSGKTTTLYAFLKAVNKPGIKIITLENPIEYHLKGIVQTQIGGEYTFASGLRAILRQDPDVIMVGEIRDPEVASTAAHAALTGHLVFSTLHTNNAAGTFPRLIDIGVQPEILGSAINVTMAQRLTRKLCEHCRRTVPIDGKSKQIIERVFATIPRPDMLPTNRDTMWEAVGCEHCTDTGYKGRIAILEAILMDEKVEEVVRHNPTELEIWRAASQQGIRRMAEHGLIKVLEGITSLDELGRVVNLEEQLR